MAVPQTLVVFFFDLGPGEAVGKLDPAVGLAQTQERLLEFKQVVYTAENGGYPPTQNGDIRSLFWLFSLMALQN